MISPGLLAALSWRLVDLDLVGIPEDPADPAVSDEERLLRALASKRGRAQAALLLAASRRCAPTGLEALRQLAEALVQEEFGRPVFVPAPGWEDVSRTIDPSVLPLAWRCLGPPGPPDGALTIGRGRCVFHEVTGRAMAELHVHLGGAVPTAMAWALAVSQLLPDQVFPAPAEARLSWRETWDDALARAGRHLWTLAFRQGQVPTPTPNGLDGRPEWRPLASDMEALLGIGAFPFEAERREGVRPELLLAVAERSLLAQALRATFRGEDPAVLLEYLAIRNAFHRVLIHGPGEAGLDRFRRVYDRAQFPWRLAGNGLRNNSQRLALDLEEQRTVEVVDAYLADSADGHPRDSGPSLAALDLELRIPPLVGPLGAELMRARARGVRRALAAWPGAPVRVGFIVHLLKSRAPSNPGDALDRAVALVAFLIDNPAWRRLIVGLDAAGDEQSAPPRDYAAAFRSARGRADGYRTEPGDPPIRLAFTYHVGEDFPDLLTGVRHVDEVVHLLAWRTGDRLGHALAIALDPGAWYHSRPDWELPVGIRLLDLLWAWRRLRATGCPHEHVRAELYRLAACAGSKLDLLGWEQLASALDAEEGGAEVALEADLVARMGVSRDRAEQLIPAAAKSLPICDVVASVQAAVRATIRRMGVVLELNPTSNTHVSGLARMSDLPYQTIVPISPLLRLQEGLRATIGADDPAVFQTTLREEYARLGEAFVGAGSPRPVVEWLDELRRTGLDATFLPRTLPRGPALAALLDELLAPGDYP